MHTRIAPVLFLLSLYLLGCPESDDIIPVSDLGYKQQDILVNIPGDAPEPTDTPLPNDLGKEVVDGDTKTGCTSDQECQEPGLTPEVCKKQVCEFASGKCMVGDLPDGSPCNDDSACTETSCQDGVCKESGQVDCDDNNQCTLDKCETKSGCLHINTLESCDDGDPCTDGDKCNNGACNPGMPACVPGSLEKPADSCNHIAQFDGVTNGVYYIKPVGGGNPIQVYCNLESAPGTGWIRVAIVKGEHAVCSYSAGIGNSAELLGNPTTTVAMSGAVSTKLPMIANEIMLITSLGRYVFKTTNPQWNWLAVGGGTINSSNLAEYGVEGSLNGGPFIALKNTPITGKGAVMLGGLQASDNKYTPFIGIGAQMGGAFSQDDNCKNTAANLRGVFGGTAFLGGGKWNMSGEILIR